MLVRKIIISGVIAGIAASVLGCTLYCLLLTGMLTQPLAPLEHGIQTSSNVPGMTTLFLYLKAGISAYSTSPMALTGDLKHFGSLAVICAAISGVASFWKDTN